MKDKLKNLSEYIVDNPLSTILIFNAIAVVIIIMRIHTPADRVREQLTAKIETIEVESQRAKNQVNSLQKDLAATQGKLKNAIELVAASELLNRSLTDTYYRNKKTQQAEVDTIITYLKLVQIEQNKLTK